MDQYTSLILAFIAGVLVTGIARHNAHLGGIRSALERIAQAAEATNDDKP